MNDSADASILHGQLEYYRARAGEYDEWWLRQGRYDRGTAQNEKWSSDAASLAAALRAFKPGGHILELACGTGLWTSQLLPYATTLTAIDGAAEMLAINKTRIESSKVTHLQADLFHWIPERKYDTIFFSFWLSHIPPHRFDPFWQTLREALAPGGRVFFIDSRREHSSTAVDHQLPPEQATTLTRRLNDGREFSIYKLFYDPAELTAKLSSLGWKFDISSTEHYFIFGSGVIPND